MKMSNKNLGIIVAVVILVGIAAFLLLRGHTTTTINNSIKSPPKVVVNSAKPLVSSSPIASPPLYTAAEKEKVRSEFVTTCTARTDQKSSSICSCAADYLSTHYSDIELAKMYVQYHSFNEVPQEVKTAINSCASK